MLKPLTTEELLAKVAPPPELPEPTFTELAENFSKATAAWTASGFKIVGEQEYQSRGAICEQCPKWDGAARFGLGKCRLCGCTKMKLWLATSKCPLEKW